MQIYVKSVNAEVDQGYFGDAGKDRKIEATEYKLVGSSEKIMIHLSDSITSGTGERGGNPKTTNYYAVLNLLPADIQRILEEAICRKLVKIPGLEELEAAKVLLSQAIEKLHR